MKTMTSAEIRKKFLEYFEKNGHKHIESSSLVPANDPTLLFTNAGMVPFKDVFLGKEKRSYDRAVTCQRCVRASGKHNDLENVGYTTRHHTFFEMLGNFSFGDYFKKEAIHYAWDFLTNVLEIPSERLVVTIHQKDDEAAELWAKEFKSSNKFPQGGIEKGFIRCGDKDNFWAMGETGPCGYCSEIFYDHDPNGTLGLTGGKPGEPDEGGDRYVEIWNLVFMQFERNSKGVMTPLPKPSVDTGMGLERITAVMQGKHDNYNTAEFFALTSEVENQCCKLIKESERTPEVMEELSIAKRVVADHIRAAVFLIADGILPSNEGRGYVLRGIIRRAAYHLYMVGVRQPCLAAGKGWFADAVVNTIGMKKVYPELELAKKLPGIEKIITREEKQFLETLDRGVKILDQELEILEHKKIKIIPGLVAFNLHDTYGFPIILTTEIAKKRGFTVDQAGFETEMEKQRERSRAASKFGNKDDLEINISGETKFIGYETTSATSEIRALLHSDGKPTENLQAGSHGIIILKETPFYAESGGQVGDTGILRGEDNAEFTVTDTKKHGTLILHFGSVTRGNFHNKTEVNAQVDEMRRQAIKLNHSAAHLLHSTLHKVLGEHASQRGSLVDAEKLRFDFAHSSALSIEEINTIEDLVNAKIRANSEVKTTVKTLEEAKKDGAIALFGEKYGEEVRVVTMKDAKELCGGTHVMRTGDIGLFKIQSESGVAAGIRRIEALTGQNALDWVRKNAEELKSLYSLLKVNCGQACEKLEQLFDEKRNLEKELTNLKGKAAMSQGENLANQSQKISGVNVLAAKVDITDSNALRTLMDQLKQKIDPAVILLAAVNSDKIQLLAGVSKSISNKFHAGNLLQHIAKQVGGSGGGRPDLAQGGGTDVGALDAALKLVGEWVKSVKP
ncbi:MAG: alanine--tRNA ligase [Gammaproteobacteria bacterium]